MPPRALQTGRTLVRSLLAAARRDHPAGRVKLVETHISWVVLADEYAYKIKKPLNLGFLDFSTPAKRRRFCREELRLNRRLAPQLYLDVVPITGTPSAPRWGGRGRILDYAVRMRRFPAAAQLDRVAGRGALKPAHIDQFAVMLAAFHGRAAVAGPRSPFGLPETIAQPIEENFPQMTPCLAGDADRRRHRRLRAWSRRDLASRRGDLLARKARGFVRECHGDLHLANMVLWNDAILPFDCLEFNERLRWIDVMSDAAFVVMDLESRGLAELANRWLNRYLEESGDYGGLSVLRTYRVYRALVRAKVTCIRLRQTAAGDPARRSLRRDYRRYLELAERLTRPSRPLMILMHGFSGSGKTVLSQQLVDLSGAVRVRSDVERKRLAGTVGKDELYGREADHRTYARLAEAARWIHHAGHSVILDAASLRREQRDLLRRVAVERQAPFIILDVEAPAPVLRARIRERAASGRDASDADLAVLDHQIATHEPLAPEERPYALTVSTAGAIAPATLLAAIGRAARVPPA